jgi:hypothetical protein
MTVERFLTTNTKEISKARSLVVMELSSSAQNMVKNAASKEI